MSKRPPIFVIAPDHAARWSDLASRSGFVDFLSPEDGFKRCARSGRPWTNKDRPGIYFWLAEDGETYIGQSVTPRSRLRQHVRDHGDVMLACFMPCAQSDLDRVEEELINQLGGHVPLRNIKLAVSTSREVPFDELVDATERERFLAGGEITDGDWQDLELLTRLQTAKSRSFWRTTVPMRRWLLRGSSSAAQFRNPLRPRLPFGRSRFSLVHASSGSTPGSRKSLPARGVPADARSAS